MSALARSRLRWREYSCCWWSERPCERQLAIQGWPVWLRHCWIVKHCCQQEYGNPENSLHFTVLCTDNPAGAQILRNDVSGYTDGLCIQTSGAEIAFNDASMSVTAVSARSLIRVLMVLKSPTTTSAQQTLTVQCSHQSTEVSLCICCQFGRSVLAAPSLIR